MIDVRQIAVHNISRVLAITRYDIEQRQSLNDLSLNIHGENYFRDVMNFIYKYNLENDNFNTQNSSCIDLIDKKKKIAYQITTTRTAEKIENTLRALKTEKYNGYKINILYLLEKSKPNSNTQDDFKSRFQINLEDHLLDSSDLIKKINDLTTPEVIELNEKYFKNKSEKYTDEIVLNLVFKDLLLHSKKIQKNYDDDFGNIDTSNKIILNKINSRISNKINAGLDYISIIHDSDDSNLISDLREYIVEGLYKKVLLEALSSKVSSVQLQGLTLVEIHQLSEDYNLDFNKILNNLHTVLESKIDISDHNSMSISWIIISFFFEICDIAIKK